MRCDQVSWRIGGGRVLGPTAFLVAGIVNVTPDSFYDGGRHPDAAAALEHALRLAEEGADVLDIGGESTRPGADEIGAEEELERVLPVVEGLRQRGLGQAVSIDTTKAAVAEQALAAGATIVNDVSACRRDPELMGVVADAGAGYVLMHAQGAPGTMQLDPRYADVVDEIMTFFEERLAALIAAGVAEECVVLDPGIGFGKTLEHNLEIFRGIDAMLQFGRPLYVGLSNKSWLSKLLGLGLEERGTATQVATALMAERGVGVHRVHDVKTTRETLRLVQEFGRIPCP